MKGSKFLAGMLSVCMLFSSLPVMAMEPEIGDDAKMESSYALEDEEGRETLIDDGDNANAEDEADISTEDEADSSVEEDSKLTEDVDVPEDGDVASEDVFDVESENGEDVPDGEDSGKDEEGLEDAPLADDVEINEGNFPDEIFRNYVLENFDKNKDGVLSWEEINDVTEIYVNDNEEIKSIEGIRYFHNLTGLDCSFIGISKLELDGLSKLEWLNCSSNYNISELDFNELNSLKVLDCSGLNVKKLNMCGIKNLEELHCLSLNVNKLDLTGLNNLKMMCGCGGSISELDLTGLNNLELLDCSCNNISELDLHDCVNLKNLYCFDLNIISLDLSECESLETLCCGGKNLTEVKVNRGLQSLEIFSSSNESSGLESLDLHDCTKLNRLCFNSVKCTNLKTINLSGSGIRNIYYSYDPDGNFSLPILESIDLTGCTQLESLSLKAEKLENLDLSDCTSLRNLALYSMPLTSLDVRNNRRLNSFTLTKDTLAEDFILYCNEKSIAETYAIENDIPYKSHATVTFISNCSVELEPQEVNWGAKVARPSGTLEDGSIVLGWFVDEDCTQHFDFDTSIMEDIMLYAKLRMDELLIDEEHFPDAGFRNWLINGGLTDSSGNVVEVKGDRKSGYYFDAEVLNMPVKINIGYELRNISSVKGIENFEGLYYLNLDCYYRNSIEELDLSDNMKLQELHCAGNHIKSLILPDSNELVKIDCSQNSLESIDISNIPALISLDCSQNNITELNVSNNSSLVSLNCNLNNIAELNVENNTALKELHCNGNNITELNVENNAALEKLYCENNNLTELNVSKNTALTKLYCGFERAWVVKPNIGKKNNITELDVRNNILLTELNCSNNGLTSLDISKNEKLTYLHCGENQLESLDISNNRLLAKLYFYNNNLKEMNVSNNTALETLDCKNNMLAKLNVSNNTALKSLECNDNMLIELNVSNNAVLKDLYCGNNMFTELDISNNDELENLDCHNNKLAELNLNDNPKLSYLYCGDNELKNLDIGNCIELCDLDCRGNQLKRLDLSKNINLYSIICKCNLLEELILPENSDMLWELNCGNNKFTNLDVSRCTNLDILYCDRNKLGSLDLSQNEFLFYLNCSNTELKELDLSKQTGLHMLLCNDNYLTSLDLSQNQELEHLEFNNNSLTSIDLSRQHLLSNLKCLGNKRLKSVDMRGNTCTIGAVEENWIKIAVPDVTTICCTEGGAIEYYCKIKYIKYSHGEPSDIPDIVDSTVSGNNPTVSGNNISIIYGDIKDAEIILSNSCIKAKKNNAAQKPVPKKVTLNGITLKNNKDYVVSYFYIHKDESGKEVKDSVEAITKAGSYEIVLKAKEGSRYIGEQSISILAADINKILMSTVKVSLEKNKYNYKDYIGQEVKPAIKSVKSGKTTLTEGRDYIVSYADNTSSGKGKVILTAMSDSDYAGTKEVIFDITGIKMSKVKVTGITTPLAFNGKGNVMQDLSKIKLTYDGKDVYGKIVSTELAEGTDYTVSYENNSRAGNAKIVFKGKGFYNGVLKKNFKISKVPLDKNMFASGAITVTHSKSGAKPDVTLTYNDTRLVNGTDYTISYKKNKAVSGSGNRPMLTIKGKGSYSGSIKNIEFTIVKKDMGNDAISIIVPDVAYNKKKSAHITKIIVYDNGALLKANKDYTIEYANNNISTLPAAGRSEVSVTITGIGNYSGSCTEKFYVVEKLISGLSAKVSGTHIYNGTPVTLDKSDIIITDKKNNNHRLTSDEFDIINYTENNHIGTAKVEVKGLGKYGGTKVIKFKISKKK